MLAPAPDARHGSSYKHRHGQAHVGASADLCPQSQSPGVGLRLLLDAHNCSTLVV